MTSIVAVSAHLPDTVPVGPLLESLGLDAVRVLRYQRIYGLSKICRTADSEADLLLAAAGKLEGVAGQEDRVRYVVRARTVPFAAPYPASPLARVRDELGLRHAKTFTLSEHACASGLLAVDLCGTLLAADGDPDALALVLLGEKAFTPSVAMIPNVGVMGEGTAAVLVGSGGSQDRLLGYATRSYGRADAAFVMSDQGAAEFRRIYADGLAEVMAAAVAQAGIALADVDLVLPHNVNRISWARSAEDLGLDPDRIFLDNVAETGHCFCADPFINFASASELGRLRPGDRYLMTSVGLGSTFSAMLFEH
jgi:3-oxoacyl-[acyl-carrier-protein] synthase-3